MCFNTQKSQTLVRKVSFVELRTHYVAHEQILTITRINKVNNAFVWGYSVILRRILAIRVERISTTQIPA